MRARAANVWNFPDPVPVHREPLMSPRRDLVAKYPTYDDKANFWRLPTLYKSVQAVDFSKDYPLIMTSGRLVEYEGGGDETRSNPWLAELQQNMFVEVNPHDARQVGAATGRYIWVETPSGARMKIMAMVTAARAGRAWSGCRSTSAAGGWARTCSTTIRKARRRSCAARRSTPAGPTATTP